MLSKYVGWGGIPNAFDDSKPDWAEEYAELKDALTPDEYSAARASTLNAHYTSPTVIRSIYEALGNMGFKSGNILEPAMGVGNFFGMLPEEMRESKLYGVELDSITGRIARQLYPKADITVAGFETTDRRDFYDVAVGNVPFGNYKVIDRAYDKLGFNIHNYFFAKALDQVRPGGIVAFVTSKYTMDAKSPEVRRYLAQRAELLGAIRLPNNAFKANAGTEVTSDIIFLQKRDRPIDIEPDWVHLGETEDGVPVNSYFSEHPEMVLGRMAWDDSMHGYMKAKNIPVIYVSAKADVQSRVQGLRLGAEDYLVKPFDILELLVRMEKVLSRADKQPKQLTYGDIAVDLESRSVTKGGEEISLKNMEYELLLTFLRHPGMVMTREDLLHQVWGDEFIGETRTVDVHVAALRRKLDLNKELATVYKIGYRLEGPEPSARSAGNSEAQPQ